MQSRKQSFKIDNFEPKYLKQSSIVLEKNLKIIEEYAQINDRYQRELFKKQSLWQKIKQTLHLD